MSDFINTVDTIGDEALTNSIIDRSITEYNDNNVTKIGYATFCKCVSLKSLYTPAVKNIDGMAFRDCISLSSVNFPSALKIGSEMFSSCTSLTSVNFPMAVTISTGAFYGCTSLTSVNFPLVETIQSTAFRSCTSLTSVNFPMVTTISTSAFWGCTSLTNVTLPSTTMANLKYSNAFNGTPMLNSSYTGSFGSIYVPSDLVETYKAAANWVTYADRITAIVE